MNQCSFARRFLVGVAALSAMGCSGGKAPTGSCTTSTTDSSTLKVSATAVVGGFIRLGDKRCTAIFEVEEHSGTYAANVWTAAHCSGISSVMPSELVVDLFDDNGYYQGIKAQEEFSAHMANAAAEAVALGSDASEVMQRSMSLMHTFQDGTATSQTFASDCATKVTRWVTMDGQSHQSGNEAGNSLVCASYKDMGLYRVVFSSNNSGEHKAVLARAAKREQKRRELVARNRSGHAAELNAWRELMIERWTLTRELSNAFFVDFLGRCDGALSGATIGTCADCNTGLFQTSTGGSSGPNAFQLAGSGDVALDVMNEETYKRACSQRSQLEGIARRHFVYGTQSLLEDAKKEGFPSAQKGYFEAFIQKKLEAKEKELQTRWAALRSWALRDTANLFALNNVTMNDEAAKRNVTRFAAFSMAEFTQGGSMNLVPTVSGFEIQIPPGVRRNVQFAPGDSGTVFAYLGIFPTVAVNSVDGTNSSGGVTYLPLPERRTASPSAPSAVAQAPQVISAPSVPDTTSVSQGAPVAPPVSPVVRAPTGSGTTATTRIEPQPATQPAAVSVQDLSDSVPSVYMSPQGSSARGGCVN